MRNKDIIINASERKVKIDKEILDKMYMYKQLRFRDKEAGGILIGREEKNTGNWFIEYATEPYPKDRRGRYYFDRKDKQHIYFYKRLYEENFQIYAYVGEWHTHPEDYPNYSSIDIKGWRNIAEEINDIDKTYFHIIVGRKDIGVWEYIQEIDRALRIY